MGAPLHVAVCQQPIVPLGQLPQLDACDIDQREAHGERPFPGNARVLEEARVEERDVDDGEDGQAAADDGPEEEAVAVNVLEEREEAVVVGVEPEHGTAEALELPRGNEDEPRQERKGRCSSAEHGNARVGKVRVAVRSEVPVVGTVDDDAERAQATRPHEDAVHNHVDDDLVGEDASLLVLGRLAHDLGRRSLAAEPKRGEGRRDHVDPDDLERGHGEDGEAGAVDKGEADDEQDDLTDVGDEEMQDELLDVVEHAAALADGGDDGVELVVGEDDLGGRLGDVGAGAHGDADVCAGERGRVVDAVARHGHEGAAAAEGLDHARLGVRGAAGDDERELFQGVNLGVGHLVELCRFDDDGRGHVLGQDVEVSGDDADFFGDGLGRLRVVAREHVDFDACLRALADGRLGLPTRRIVDAGEADEDEVLFDYGAQFVVFLGAQVEHTLNSALCEYKAILRGASNQPSAALILRGVVNDRHALDGAIKGELGDLLPPLSLEGLLAVSEAMGKDLQRNFCRLTSRLPLFFFLVEAHGGEVAERRREQESTELVSHFRLWLGTRWLLRRREIELLVRNVELEDCGAALSVIVALRLLLLIRFVCGLLLFLVVFGGLRVHDAALCGIIRVLRIVDGVDVTGRDPGLADNHGAFGQGAGFVGADVCDAAEGLEGGEVADDDVGFAHDGYGDDHCDCQDTISWSREPDRAPKQHIRQRGQLPLQRRADGQAEKLADQVVDALRQADDGLGLAVLAPVHGPAGLAVALLGGGGGGDLADLGGHAGRDGDAPAAALLDGGCCVGHVYAVGDAEVVFRGGHVCVAAAVVTVAVAVAVVGSVGGGDGGDFLDGDGFACELGFFAGEVHGFEEAEVGGDGVAHFEEDDVSWDDFRTATSVNTLQKNKSDSILSR
ncbi:hypothetical protein CCMA1212_005469 [Trichoderma ghanense]|uniref:Uncharacterized protein n=1 Tax=Trichoderma ghanense TaxID=65468 RepID=A0ABY2H5F8_9HYPO